MVWIYYAYVTCRFWILTTKFSIFSTSDEVIIIMLYLKKWDNIFFWKISNYNTAKNRQDQLLLNVCYKIIINYQVQKNNCK